MFPAQGSCPPASMTTDIDGLLNGGFQRLLAGFLGSSVAGVDGALVGGGGRGASRVLNGQDRPAHCPFPALTAAGTKSSATARPSPRPRAKPSARAWRTSSTSSSTRPCRPSPGWTSPLALQSPAGRSSAPCFDMVTWSHGEGAFVRPNDAANGQELRREHQGQPARSGRKGAHASTSIRTEVSSLFSWALQCDDACSGCCYWVQE